MPFSAGSHSRIRTNISSELAYNALNVANRDITLRQLRLSTGKRINNAADDVAGYITSRALMARNGALKAAARIAAEAQNVSNIAQDSYSNIYELLGTIREQAASASSGSLGTSEKVALGKAAFRMAQQIQTVVDSSVFGGRQLLDGDYHANFFIGTNAVNALLTIEIDLQTGNVDFNVSNLDFNVNSLKIDYFGGVTNLDLRLLNDVNAQDLGIFSDAQIGYTIVSLANAMENVTKVATYLGGISNRLASQESALNEQITNYNAAISRIADSDVAIEQLNLVKSQFLQQASLTSLSQSNQNPTAFLQLLRG